MNEYFDFGDGRKMPPVEAVRRGISQRTYPAYFLEARQLVDKLHQKLYRRGFNHLNPSYDLLIGWFPSAVRQAKLEQGDAEVFSRFIAHSLGSYAVWEAIVKERVIPKNTTDVLQLAETMQISEGQMRLLLANSVEPTLAFLGYFKGLKKEFMPGQSLNVFPYLETNIEKAGFKRIYEDPAILIGATGLIDLFSH